MRWIYWSLLSVMAAVYGVMLFWSLPALTKIAGGAAMFDLRPGGYSFNDARAVLAALGTEGRDFYLDVQQQLDTAFPALMAVVLTMTFQRLFAWRTAVIATGFAVFGAGFDYLENAAVAAMLWAGPDGLTPDLVVQASRWTVAKSVTDGVAMTLLLIGLGRAMWRRWRD